MSRSAFVLLQHIAAMTLHSCSQPCVSGMHAGSAPPGSNIRGCHRFAGTLAKAPPAQLPPAPHASSSTARCAPTHFFSASPVHEVQFILQAAWSATIVCRYPSPAGRELRTVLKADDRETGRVLMFARA